MLSRWVTLTQRPRGPGGGVVHEYFTCFTPQACVYKIIRWIMCDRDWSVLPGQYHYHSIQINSTICNSFQHKLFICKDTKIGFTARSSIHMRKKKSRRPDNHWENTCWLCKMKNYKSHAHIRDKWFKTEGFFLLPHLPETRKEISQAQQRTIAQPGFVEAWYK